MLMPNLRLLASVSMLALGLLAPAAPAAMAEEAAAAAATDEAALPAITVSTVKTAPLSDIIFASGLVTAAETVLVAPLVEGQQIQELLVQVGDTVSEGQVLARLSQATLSLQLAQLEASAGAARTNSAEAAKAAERVASLFAQGSASNTANDQAKAAATAAAAQLSQIESQLDNVRLMLKRTEVVAPVAGRVAARNAQLGAIASAAGQPMFTLIRDDALELRVDVSQAELVRLAAGQKVELILAGTDTPLAGEVRLVEPTIDPQTRLGRVRITVPQSDQVRSGMFMEARILAAERDALTVPVSAIGAGVSGLNVMRVKGDLVEMVPVKTGIRQGKWIEVTEGLAEGDTVVTKAGAFVRNGDRIRPVPADASN